MSEKKVYVPSLEELYTMQDMGANMYKYLLCKAIETLVMDGVKYSNKGMLKNAYLYLKEHPYLAPAICKMYPSELQYSEISRKEVQVCESLLERNNDKTIYNLDNLVYFDNIVLGNNVVVEKTISLLAEQLPLVPQYRFEYKDFTYLNNAKNGFPILMHNKLLNNIFSCRYGELEFLHQQAKIGLMQIEPAYALKFNDSKDEIYFSSLKNFVDMYASRYGIGRDVGIEYRNEDILTNPDNEVKRLVKCINNGEKKIKL